MSDPFHLISQAEAVIVARARTRDATLPEHRGALALEMIADELTRLNAEAKTLRYLYATASARP